MNQPLPTLFMHVHWIVFSYAPFKSSNVDMSVIIFPLARSLHDLMSLLLPQPPLLLMPLVNPMASRSSRSLIYVDTFYLIPQALLCLQEWMTMMMKTLPLQECMAMTLLLQECLYPPLPSWQMTTMTQMQNLITTLLTPMRSMKFSSKASIHSTGSHVPVHSMTSEPPQHPLDEEDPDNIELPEQETQVPVLCQSKKVSVLPSDYIPWMGGKTYAMNIQTETSQDKDKGLIYNHEEARVLAIAITIFNKCMEHSVEVQGQQYVVTYSLNAGINKFGEWAKPSANKEMKQLHDRSCFRPVYKCSLNKSERHWAMESLLLLTEKRDKMIKSWHCANGTIQCPYMECNEVISRTIHTEGALLTTVIEE